jgi:hypothetical protein
VQIVYTGLRSPYRTLLRERLPGERNSIFSFGEARDLASLRLHVDSVAVISAVSRSLQSKGVQEFGLANFSLEAVG